MHPQIWCFLTVLWASTKSLHRQKNKEGESSLVLPYKGMNGIYEGSPHNLIITVVIHSFTPLYLCVRAGMHMPLCMCGGHRAIFRSSLSPSTWVLWIELLGYWRSIKPWVSWSSHLRHLGISNIENTFSPGSAIQEISMLNLKMDAMCISHVSTPLWF